jgi:FKBP-type peptidyl-prolyl cis-trans isomerase FklB
MKKLILIAVVLSIHAIGFSQVKSKPVPAKGSLKTVKDTLSYSIGAGVADNLLRQGITDLNFSVVQKGMEDVFKKRTRLLDENTASMCIQTKLQEAAMKKVQIEKDKGNAFLAANKKRKGVTVLPGGLQYEIIIESTDPAMTKPAAEDTVVVNYVGTLIDGKEFDNSVKRGQAATFPVNGVIKGWTEILQLMPVGSKWKVYIPSDLAYGDRGAGGSIPPGATLIFEISLEGIKPSAKKQ